jgi:preprotein translocase subunit SecA
MAQRDPLVEYQREGYDLFIAMMDGIKEESVGYMFNVEVTVTPHVHEDGETHSDIDVTAKGLEAQPQPANLQYTAPSESGETKTTVVSDDAYAGVGRNDVCPCGSGKKFKKCHGAAA